MSQIIDDLVHFDGPPDQFLQHLLAGQCRIGEAEGGLLARSGRGGKLEPLVVHPALEPGQPPPFWVGTALEAAAGLKTPGSEVLPLQSPDELYGADPQRCLVLLPILGLGGTRAVAVFVVSARAGRAHVEQLRQRLELTTGLLSLYEMRLTLQRRELAIERLRRSGQILAELNQLEKFQAVAMALCNQVAAQWQADRVSLGLLRGRYVKLAAMSHTEKFTRKMELVQAIESTMEECLDQDLEVIYPTSPESTTLKRAAQELAQRHGPSRVLSMPLRYGGKPLAVLTLERPTDQPLSLEDIESLRLTLDLCTARLVEMDRRDLGPVARVAAGTRSLIEKAVGPRHTWAKATVLGAAAAVLFLVFARGTYRVEGSFTIEPGRRQVLVAPFAGYLASVAVRPGDPIEAGKTVLATLDTSQLELDLAQTEAERQGHLKEAQIARRENKIADQQVAEARAAQTQAKIDLLRWQISRAQIVAPFDGWLLEGDLLKEIGKPLEQGQKLFDVGPLEGVRAEMLVEEGQVLDLKPGQTGWLASASHPGDFLAFEVERIDPVAEVVEQQNVFRARLVLKDNRPWLRPGMEGVAKVDVGPRRYAWIWSRDLVHWVRMKLWF